MDAWEHYIISRQLEKYHPIFDKLWSMGIPRFDEKIPTAAVCFNKLGENIDFIINPNYWKTLNDEQKKFIICHECLHVILYHGLRIKDLPSDQLINANKTLDIVVNHALVKRFGFERKQIDPNNEYCWIDTVFPNDNTIEEEKFFEYYFSKIKNSNPGIKSKGNLVDDHSMLDSFNNQQLEKIIAESTDEEIKQLSDFIKPHMEDKDMQEKCQQAGLNKGGLTYVANVVKVVKKKKWETVIKKWANKYIQDTIKEQWTRKNRRLAMIGDEFMLPSEGEVEEVDKKKIQVWFFQDTSGSCMSFRDRFFTAARTLPDDVFDVRMHCFDTEVYETDLKSGKLYGFGGTTFTCIEKYIQKEIQKYNIAYPTAIFVITDGYGDRVTPEKPENWYWFIDGSFGLLPKTSNMFNLKDFE